MPIFAEILGWEILVPVALIVILFGGSKIPQLARSLGQAKNESAKGMSEAEARQSPTMRRNRAVLPTKNSGDAGRASR